MTPSLWLSSFFDLLDTWEIYFWSCYELWEWWWWWPSQPSEDPQWKMQCQVIKQTWEKLNPPRIRSYSSGCNCAEREKIEVFIWISYTSFVCLCLFVMLVFVCLSMRELVIIRPRLSHWAEKKEYNLTAENGNHGGVICHTHTGCKFFINGGSIHFVLFPEGVSFCGSTLD